MLVLPTLHKLLSQVLSPPELHTAVLFTPSGQLVSYAADPPRCKDDVRVIVGVSTEVWQEIEEQGVGMAESEVGRIVVLPIEDPSKNGTDAALPNGNAPHEEPLMLIALNATDAVDWDVLEIKGRELTGHLSRPIGKLREPLKTASMSPSRHNLNTEVDPKNPGVVVIKLPVS